MKRHFTASVFIVYQNQILLHPHPKLKKHLPPGGHVEENELPHEAAIRETFEETGLKIQLYYDEHILLTEENAKTFPRPYLCLQEKIPIFKNTPAHEHMDLVYIGFPIDNIEPREPFTWFSLEMLQNLTCPEMIFPDTKEIATHILQRNSTNVFRDALLYDQGIS